MQRLHANEATQQSVYEQISIVVTVIVEKSLNKALGPFWKKKFIV